MKPLRREARITEQTPKIRWDWPAKHTPPYNWHAHRCWPRDGYYKQESPFRMPQGDQWNGP